MSDGVYACCDRFGQNGWLYLRAASRTKARIEYQEATGDGPGTWLTVRALRRPDLDTLTEDALFDRLCADYPEEDA